MVLGIISATQVIMLFVFIYYLSHKFYVSPGSVPTDDFETAEVLVSDSNETFWDINTFLIW